MDMSPLKEPVLRDELVEAGLIKEKVILAINLARTRLPGGGGNRDPSIGDTLKHPFHQRALSGP